MSEYQLVGLDELTRLRLSDLTYRDAIRQRDLATEEADEWRERALQAEAKLELIEEAEDVVTFCDSEWDEEYPCDPDCPCECSDTLEDCAPVRPHEALIWAIYHAAAWTNAVAYETPAGVANALLNEWRERWPEDEAA